MMRAAGILAASLTLWGCGKTTEAGQTDGETMTTEAGQTDGDTMTAEAGQTDDEIMTAERAGDTFSVMGDSISTFQGHNPAGYYAFFPESGAVSAVEDTWWQQVAEDLELTLLTNGSSSGATVAGDSTGSDPQCGSNELRTGALAGPDGACPDRIIVYLGANDMIQAVPLGDNDGTRPVQEGEVAAFSDAYTLMLDKLQAKYPAAEIYCCTLHQMGNYGTETPYVEFVNGAGLTAQDYGDVIAGIAKNRGLYVIDLYRCGIAVENLQETTSDGVHPSAAGMAFIAEAVKKGITGE